MKLKTMNACAAAFAMGAAFVFTFDAANANGTPHTIVVAGDQGANHRAIVSSGRIEAIIDIKDESTCREIANARSQFGSSVQVLCIAPNGSAQRFQCHSEIDTDIKPNSEGRLPVAIGEQRSSKYQVGGTWYVNNIKKEPLGGYSISVCNFR